MEKKIIFIFIIMFFAGVIFGLSGMYSVCRTKAIDNNCGYYDTKTGDFEWNTVEIESAEYE